MSSKLEKKDIRKAGITWWLSSQLTYNYQRLQAGGFAATMGPILAKLYGDDKESISKGLERHMLYFNTEPRFGAFLPGMVVALEEGIANNPNDESDTNIITELKTALMGPLAGIGDTITQGLAKPLLLSITLGWAQQGYIWGALVFGIGFTLFDFIVTQTMFHQGYKLGIDSIDKFLDTRILNKLTTFLGIVGLFSLGAMIVKYVPVQAITEFKLATGTISIGDTLNKIIPSFLPLLFTLLAYWLQVKGHTVTKVLLILFAIGFVGGAIGILG